MEKLKFLAAILLACLGSFTIGIYAITTHYKIDSYWAPGGHIEIYRWVTTILFTFYFILLSIEQAKKLK